MLKLTLMMTTLLQKIMKWEVVTFFGSIWEHSLKRDSISTSVITKVLSWKYLYLSFWYLSDSDFQKYNSSSTHQKEILFQALILYLNAFKLTQNLFVQVATISHLKR